MTRRSGASRVEVRDFRRASRDTDHSAMASKSRDITLAAPSHVSYGLARAAGAELPGFRLSREDPAGYYLEFSRGFGWTNPTELKVTVYQLDAQSSQLRLNASILALVDPFGFLDSALDMFENHLRAHHQASLSGVRPPPPPRTGAPSG